MTECVSAILSSGTPGRVLLRARGRAVHTGSMEDCSLVAYDCDSLVVLPLCMLTQRIERVIAEQSYGTTSATMPDPMRGRIVTVTVMVEEVE